jgi:phosphopantetheinyl transferase
MSLYICDISDFMNLDGLGLVTPARKTRVLAYRQAADRARSLVSGLLLRRFCGVTDDGQLHYGENGKPALKDQSLCFNLSHSGNYVALAVAENEVGVDIEKVAPYHRAVPARCFQADEQEWLERQGTDEAFYYLWTAKESVMKALGQGLSLSPPSFSVLPVDSSPRQIAGKTMYLDWLPHDGHMLCRAVLNHPEPFAPRMVNPPDVLQGDSE